MLNWFNIGDARKNRRHTNITMPTLQMQWITFFVYFIRRCLLSIFYRSLCTLPHFCSFLSSNYAFVHANFCDCLYGACDFLCVYVCVTRFFLSHFYHSLYIFLFLNLKFKYRRFSILLRLVLCIYCSLFVRHAMAVAHIAFHSYMSRAEKLQQNMTCA